MRRARSRRLRVAPLLGALAFVAALGAAGAAGGDAPPDAATAVDGAFARLGSRLLSERRQGVETLIRSLPGVRDRVVAALAESPWNVQVHLIEVLAQDGSPAAEAALLRHLDRTDETQAVLIRLGLVRDAAASERLLGAYRRDPRAFLKGTGAGARAARRRLELVRLLERAEIEQLFLSRKSKTGSTGYYEGQYEILADEKRDPGYRDLAVQVVAGIALDEAVPTPGVYSTGVYEFLRPHHVDEWELRGMATNAVSELCTSEDKEILARLAARLGELQERRDQLQERLYRLSRRVLINSKPFQDLLFEWDDAIGEYADLLTCIYGITPDTVHTDLVEELLQELEHYEYARIAPIRPTAMRAAVLIRVGWYKRAIEAYDESMRWGGSYALGYYNQACAYASWSLQEGLSARRRIEYRLFALHKLGRAVDSGWSDVGWMTEDRDLDPIRDDETYAKLVEKIRKRILPPEED
jgi:hypothetical protein